MTTLDVENYVENIIFLIGTYLEEKGITRGNPCGNTGSAYENNVFLISAYDWRDDIPENEYVPNFWYKPLNYQVKWYKHIGRGNFSNRPMPIDDAIVMFEKCIASLQGAAAIVAASDGLEVYWEVEEYDEE